MVILKNFLKTTNFFVDKYESFRIFCRYRITNKITGEPIWQDAKVHDRQIES